MTKKATETCPDCDGRGTTRARYTEPETVCPTCGGEGVVPTDGEQAAQAVEAEAIAKPPKETDAE